MSRRATRRPGSRPERGGSVVGALGVSVSALLAPLVASALLAASAAAGVTCPEGTHTLVFTNDCSYDIWLAELGNTETTACTDWMDCGSHQFCNVFTCSTDAKCPAISCSDQNPCPLEAQTCSSGLCTPTCNSGHCACRTTMDCPDSGTCSGNLCGGGLCQFETVVPESWETVVPESWELSKHGGSTTLCMPRGWGGRFWGRTGCTPGENMTLTCDTGQCGVPGLLDCKVSGSVPSTLFEPTFDAAGVDYYDVSLVSGYNVPIQVTPSKQSCVATGACTRDLNATCPEPLRVLGATTCPEGSCPDGGACVGGSCVIGCLDPCDACNANMNAAGLDCAMHMHTYCCEGHQTNNSCNSASATCFDDKDCRNLANGDIQATCDTSTNLCVKACTQDSDCPEHSCDTDAGQCSPPVVSCTNSCVARGDMSTCDTGVFPGGGVCVPPTDCCGPYNPDWVTAAQKAGGGGTTTWTAIFKAACPTAYSYQFDDPTSEFTCADPMGSEVDYDVVFCPVPEPAASLLAASALLALSGLRVRRR